MKDMRWDDRWGGMHLVILFDVAHLPKICIVYLVDSSESPSMIELSNPPASNCFFYSHQSCASIWLLSWETATSINLLHACILFLIGAIGYADKVPTNSRKACVLGKDFFSSACNVIQGKNSLNSSKSARTSTFKCYDMMIYSYLAIFLSFFLSPTQDGSNPLDHPRAFFPDSCMKCK